MQSQQNDGTEEFVIDGSLIPKDQHSEIWEKIRNIIDAIGIPLEGKKRPSLMEINGRILCIAYHNKKDEAGRTSQVYITWKKGTSENEILRSAKLLGVTNELDSVLEELFKKII